MLHQIDLADLRLKGHSIVPMMALREGMPFDLGVFIDGTGFKFQVKSTEHRDAKGKMSFATCKDGGKLYNKNEIDFFLLYCADPEWYGLALPSECGKATYVYDRPTKNQNSYQQEQLDFQLRFRELVETGDIQPISSSLQKKVKPLPVVARKHYKRPKDTSEFLGLMADNQWNDEYVAMAMDVSVATVQKWRKNFLEPSL